MCRASPSLSYPHAASKLLNLFSCVHFLSTFLKNSPANPSLFPNNRLRDVTSLKFCSQIPTFFHPQHIWKTLGSHPVPILTLGRNYTFKCGFSNPLFCQLFFTLHSVTHSMKHPCCSLCLLVVSVHALRLMGEPSWHVFPFSGIPMCSSHKLCRTRNPASSRCTKEKGKRMCTLEEICCSSTEGQTGGDSLLLSSKHRL